MNVGIIGSGIGGLATAIRLANKGYQVTVFEKNAQPGGKMSEIKVDGYRFDTGPSLFTLPNLLEELFFECGENISDYMQYDLIENNCKYIFANGTEFNFYHDKEMLRKEVETKTQERFECIDKRLRASENIYNLSAPVFIFSAFQKLSNFATPQYKNMVFKLHKLNFLKTMHQANMADFKDYHIVQLFDRYATYNGSNPYLAPATLNMIAHLENNVGSFFPKKGMYQIVRSLYEIAIKKGIQFEFSSLVDKIEVENQKATALWVNGKKHRFDIIVSDTDAKYAANYLFNSPLKKRINRQAPSSSAIIFYWGMKGIHSQLDLHNIFFSGDYKKEFDAIFTNKTIYNDPTIYIFISSKAVKTDAPENGENWFVMINVPANDAQDWNQLIKEARKNIINKINTLLSISIEEHIEYEQIGSPLTIEKNTLSVGGALYGSASNSMFSAFLRHPNFIRDVKNLYFVGGSVHPGGGIPLCIASSQIVSNEIPSLM